MTAWLIEQAVYAELCEARRVFAGEAITEGLSARSREGIAKQAGAVTQISIHGTLTKRRDFIAMFFGGGNTLYGEIEGALAAAAADKTVRQVVLDIDSPGGTVDGLFETLAAIRDFRASGKRLSVRASRASSAAYGIAAMAGKISATSDVATFGSIGVAFDYRKDDPFASVTNTDSPNKRPDLETEEGRATVREYLDSVAEQFIAAIASGRGTDPETVRTKFGRGAVFTAAEAKKRKMIDATPGPVLRAVAGGAGKAATTQRERAMDLEQLKAEHPEVYRAAVQAGIAEERDRVVAHLELGEKSGAMDVASKAIRGGDELTQSLTATYLSAGMSAAAQKGRQLESNATEDLLEGVQPAADQDMGDRIAAHLGY